MHDKRRVADMYHQYADEIYRFLYVHVRDTELAEDLTGDTFLKALKASERFDFKQPRPWLYTIARHTLTDHWRKKHPERLEEGYEAVDETQDSIEEKTSRKLEVDKVRRAIHQLPTDMRSVVFLRLVKGLSTRDTAKALRLSEANIRVIQFRALQRLRKVLA